MSYLNVSTNIKEVQDSSYTAVLNNNSIDCADGYFYNFTSTLSIDSQNSIELTTLSVYSGNILLAEFDLSGTYVSQSDNNKNISYDFVFISDPASTNQSIRFEFLYNVYDNSYNYITNETVTQTINANIINVDASKYKNTDFSSHLVSKNIPTSFTKTPYNETLSGIEYINTNRNTLTIEKIETYLPNCSVYYSSITHSYIPLALISSSSPRVIKKDEAIIFSINGLHFFDANQERGIAEFFNLDTSNEGISVTVEIYDTDTNSMLSSSTSDYLSFSASSFNGTKELYFKVKYFASSSNGQELLLTVRTPNIQFQFVDNVVSNSYLTLVYEDKNNSTFIARTTDDAHDNNKYPNTRNGKYNIYYIYTTDNLYVSSGHGVILKNNIEVPSLAETSTIDVAQEPNPYIISGTKYCLKDVAININENNIFINEDICKKIVYSNRNEELVNVVYKNDIRTAYIYAKLNEVINIDVEIIDNSGAVVYRLSDSTTTPVLTVGSTYDFKYIITFMPESYYLSIYSIKVEDLDTGDILYNQYPNLSLDDSNDTYTFTLQKTISQNGTHNEKITVETQLSNCYGNREIG